MRKLVGRKRTLEILELISEKEALNYSEIEQEIESSSDTIVTSLDHLVEYGLVERDEQTKKNVIYSVSERGDEFLRIMVLLEELLEDET